MKVVVSKQWRIQDLRDRDSPAPKGDGSPTYYLGNFRRKVHESEEILAIWPGASPVQAPLPDRRLLTDFAGFVVFCCVVTSPTGTRVVGACALLHHRGTVDVNSTSVTNLSCEMSEEMMSSIKFIVYFHKMDH